MAILPNYAAATFAGDAIDNPYLPLVENTIMTYSGSKVDEDSMVGKHDKSPRLGISLTHFSWSVDDAIKAFKAANKFLDNFFRDLCGLDDKVVRLLLLAPVGGDVEDIFLSTKELEELQKNYDIPLSYVGTGVEE